MSPEKGTLVDDLERAISLFLKLETSFRSSFWEKKKSTAISSCDRHSCNWRKRGFYIIWRPLSDILYLPGQPPTRNTAHLLNLTAATLGLLQDKSRVSSDLIKGDTWFLSTGWKICEGGCSVCNGASGWFASKIVKVMREISGKTLRMVVRRFSSYFLHSGSDLFKGHGFFGQKWL